MTTGLKEKPRSVPSTVTDQERSGASIQTFATTASITGEANCSNMISFHTLAAGRHCGCSIGCVFPLTLPKLT